MLNEDHKEVASGKKKDDEGYMARVELDQIERSIEKLRKVIKTGDYQLPAWVQSKITRAADFIDTAAEYLQSDEGIKEAKDPSFAIKKSSGAGALTPSAAKQLGPKAVELQKKKAASVNLPKLKEEISLVEMILGEEKCGKGMYWCNTDKKCKPLPDGFNTPGQSKKPTEVGIGKNVDGTKAKCSHTGKGSDCAVHGKKACPVKEEKDPKGPTKSYKTPQEIADKHGVSVESIKKQLKMGIKVEGEHTTSSSAAKITALQHLDEVPDYYTKLKKVESKKSVSEATRIKSQTGNIISVAINWRGKYYYLQMFFPQLSLPSRGEIAAEIQKIYPDSRVVSYKVAQLDPNAPVVQVSNTPSKNYLLNNKTIGEEVEIEEAKKSEMPCNKPKAEAHGSGETGKSHVVKACENGKEKLIRFGQKGVKGSPKKKGESEEYANRRERFQARHAKNISKGKMSAAYWANKVKW